MTVKTVIKKHPGVKIVFNYEIFNENNELINIGETKLAFIDTSTGRPCRMPDDMAGALSGYF